MNIFFDTEFTGLHKDTKLISIGMVAEDGKKFYAEFTDYDIDKCRDDEWLSKYVIDNLLLTNIDNGSGTNLTLADGTIIDMYIKGDKTAIRNGIVDFIYPYHAPELEKIQLVSDCSHYDMVLFIDIFGSAFQMPLYISPVCYDINNDIAKFLNIPFHDAFDISREVFIDKIANKNYSTNLKHNALYDAIVIKDIYDAVRKFK